MTLAETVATKPATVSSSPGAITGRLETIVLKSAATRRPAPAENNIPYIMKAVFICGFSTDYL